jgi:alkyldihydroxyacetonephosphate synthase
MEPGIDHTLRGGWANGDHALPPHALRWLRTRTGLAEHPTPVAPDSVLAVPDPELSIVGRAALESVVGAEHLLLDRDSRLGRSGGMSYVDLLRHRGCGELAVPDAVVLPGDPDEVVAVLKACAEHDIGVIPFGGGTSVVGGVTALRGGKPSVIVLDLARLNRLVSIDPLSRLVVLQAGVRATDAERMLAAHGFTLGHFPQSFERATIGGFAATRSAGQASAGYGRFEDMVDGVRLATPVGELHLGVAPATAAGPDLKQLVIGSEGAFGVITEVTLRVRPVPTHTRYEGYFLNGWDKATAAVRDLAQHRVLADVTRLSDTEETEVQLALTGGVKAGAVRAYLRARRIGDPCLLILGWEAGSAGELAVRRAATLRTLRAHQYVRLGKPIGEAWRHGRFSGPRQRDSLLDAGVCVETLETATHWSQLSTLRTAVRGALQRSLSRAVVMCHVSHAYETGASLYFTVLAARADEDPIGQWQRAKRAASEAIAPLGTITHHHAVGTDHAPYLAGEVGALGIDVMTAVKRAFDPTGVLNPGKLLPAADRG